MFLRSSIVLLFTFAVAGCATPSEDHLIHANHPASTEAPEGAFVPTSVTLSTVDTTKILEASRGADGPHAGHNHGAMKPASMPMTQPSTAALPYVCPMHPEVRSAKADDRCPKCNMKLIKAPAATIPTQGGQHDHH